MGYIFAAMVCVIVGVVLIILVQHFVDSNHRRHLAKLAENNRRESDNRLRMILDQQVNIGNRIFNALCQSARDNPSGKVRVERIAENGNIGYSVIVGWGESSSITYGGVVYAGYPIVQVDVNIATGKLHIFYGGYGPDKNHRISEVDAILIQLVTHVKTWSPTR